MGEEIVRYLRRRKRRGRRRGSIGRTEKVKTGEGEDEEDPWSKVCQLEKYKDRVAEGIPCFNSR